MSRVIPSFIVGMSGGAVLADGIGVRATLAEMVLCGLLNGYCAYRIGKARP